MKHLASKAVHKTNRLATAKKTLQKGFTMVELLVVVAVLGILAALVSGGASTDTTKATTLYVNMDKIKSSMELYKADTGTYPNKLGALWDKSLASTAANNFSGLSTANTWQKPYLDRGSLDASNKLKMDTIADGAVADITTATVGADRQLFVRATNVPKDLIKIALKKCNGNEDLTPTATLSNSKCAGTIAAGAEIGSFDVLVNPSM